MYFKDLLSFVLFLILPITKGAIPGTFFWRPRFGLDMAIPTTEPTVPAYQPNKKNIHDGLVVLVDGYDVLTSVIGLAQGIQYAQDEDTMNPLEGIYFTNIYRWALRTIDLLPYWVRGNFHDALSVWCNRFKFMNAELPDWLRKALPWISKESWNKEKVNLKKFRRDSEVAFSQFYRFPSKTYDNFRSFEPISADEMVFSSVDRDDFTYKDSSKERKALEKALQDQKNTPSTNISTSSTNVTHTTNSTTNATSTHNDTKLGGGKEKHRRFLFRL